MQYINRLSTNDVIHIIAQHFGVSDRSVQITGASYDSGDGPYPAGYRVSVEVEVNPDRR